VGGTEWLGKVGGTGSFAERRGTRVGVGGTIGITIPIGRGLSGLTAIPTQLPQSRASVQQAVRMPPTAPAILPTEPLTGHEA
jgi:hypothetical protein